MPQRKRVLRPVDEVTKNARENLQSLQSLASEVVQNLVDDVTIHGWMDSGDPKERCEGRRYR